MEVIAIDFGGTRCKTGLVRGGEIHEPRLPDTPRHGSLEQMLRMRRDLDRWPRASGYEIGTRQDRGFSCFAAPFLDM